MSGNHDKTQEFDEHDEKARRAEKPGHDWKSAFCFIKHCGASLTRSACRRDTMTVVHSKHTVTEHRVGLGSSTHRLRTWSRVPFSTIASSTFIKTATYSPVEPQAEAALCSEADIPDPLSKQPGMALLQYCFFFMVVGRGRTQVKKRSAHTRPGMHMQQCSANQ